MSGTSDARKVAALILPVLTFGLVFYVMYQNERARAPVWHPAEIGSRQAAALSDGELADAIAREWVQTTVAPQAVPQDVTVTVDSPRQPDAASRLEATVAGTLQIDDADRRFTLVTTILVTDKRVTYAVNKWELD